MNPRLGSDPAHRYSDIWMAFLDYITSSVFDPPNVNTTSIDIEEWVAVMSVYGLNLATMHAIVLPRFTYLRQFTSCAFICKDTIEMRLAAYESSIIGRKHDIPRGIADPAIEAPPPPEGCLRLYVAVDMARTDGAMDAKGVMQSF